ncbi:MAG: ribulose 1,5-bisphosphate carboxylase [Candidatus Lokiarchaeota archaeon]|nr:ribulose 1,5-bisphosphate carboxylase [Candidatus Lokiarchaeota archaeon]
MKECGYEKPDYLSEPLALPETVDFNEYIVCTYIGHISADINVDVIGPALAIEQSTGTFTPVPAETPEVRRKHVAKVISYTQIPDYEYERPGRRDEPKRWYMLQLAFPYINVKNTVGLMFTAIFGNISMGGELKMVDIRFPEKFIKDFKGPKFGIEGVRNLLGVPERPLLNNMIKPCTYTWAPEFAELFYSAAVGGCDVVKDDELVANQDFNTLEQRVPAFMEMADKAEEESGEKTLYTANITDKLPECLENAEKVQEMGGNALMINFPVMGYEVLRAIAEDPSIKLPILGHMDFAGSMYMAPKYGVSSHLILGKLARLCGADIVVHPAPYGKASVIQEKYVRVAHTLRYPFYHIKQTFPMPSGGITAGLVDRCMRDLGNDIMIGSGGGIHAHPDGPEAGAKAFRQAIDATMQGIKLREYGKDHKELGRSLGVWKPGKKTEFKVK